MLTFVGPYIVVRTVASVPIILAVGTAKIAAKIITSPYYLIAGSIQKYKHNKDVSRALEAF